jgi:hypothetical protein
MKQTEPAFAWPSLPPFFVRAPARLRLLSRQVEPCAMNKIVSLLFAAREAVRVGMRVRAGNIRLSFLP